MQNAAQLLDFQEVIDTNRRQHLRIQNLQRANIYLKSKLKELDSGKVRFNENIFGDQA